MTKLVEKTCKAKGCGRAYTGAPQSQFCCPECRKIGKPKEGFVSETILIKSEEILAKEENYKKEKAATEAKRAILSLPTDKMPVVLLKSNSTNLIQDVKNALIRSTTLEQIISNIAMKHKYKKPESYVSHIEDMLILYAQD